MFELPVGKEGKLKMARKISVFHPNNNKRPMWGVKRSIAMRLVAEKKAINHEPYRNAITLIPFELESPLICGQERAYEQAGISKFRRVFNGGLTRTEHNPR